jgi:predicted nucleotidyltransferase
LWSSLSDRPDIDRFRRYIDAVLAQRGEEIEFIVLFGSMARGNWSLGSDYDLLIGLRVDDGKRLLDRIYEFERIAPAPIEPFVYSRSEWMKMWGDLHLTFLEAADYGVVLFDRGGWGKVCEEFERRLRTGSIERHLGGWRRGVKAPAG